MSKLTAKEILKKLEESGFEVATFANDESEYTSEISMTGDGLHLTSDYEKIQKKWKELKASLGGWKEVAQHGGEGQGDEWYSVKYFPAHELYIKTDGFYASYYGTDFDEGDFGYEVMPEEKVITVYRKV